MDENFYENSAFARTTARLSSIFGQYGEIVQARRIPRERESLARRIQPTWGDGGWNSHKPQGAAEAIEKSKVVLARFAEAEREEGRAEMNERLIALADELERTRAVLPQLAAALSIELGVIARGLRKEAEQPQGSLGI